MIKIVNTETGEAIERELNAEELAQQQIDDAADLAFKEVKEAQAKAKSALLEKLGITEDEAKLLLV
jgi:vacuolar-type H+-ATPase subunit H